MCAFVAEVDDEGIIRFFHNDINRCRDFLFLSGLEPTQKGWYGNGQRGGIAYVDNEKGLWSAVRRYVRRV